MRRRGTEFLNVPSTWELESGETEASVSRHKIPSLAAETWISRLALLWEKTRTKIQNVVTLGWVGIGLRMIGLQLSESLFEMLLKFNNETEALAVFI